MIIKDWKILKSRTLHRTPWMEFIEDEFEFGGKRNVYCYIRRLDGPAMIVESNEGKIWLVRQYRLPIRKFLWQLPAEGVSENENFEDAAKRGVEEEVGVKIKQLIPLSGIVHPDPGSISQKTQFFLARGLSDNICVDKVETAVGEVEEIESRLFSMEEIDKMVESGDVCDNWTLAGLYLYKRYLEKNK